MLPTTGAFDSRTQRIAETIAGRGHRVTIVARSGPGLPNHVEDARGWQVIRVPVSAIGGLPLPARVRTWLSRRWSMRRDAGLPAEGSPSGDPAGLGRSAPGRALAGVRRVGAIALTVRSQVIATRKVAPDADLYHGMAFMGIPVALALSRRRHRRAPVVYDARDIYVDANNLARLPRPLRAALGRLERGWVRAADAIVTVNSGYAAVMAERWRRPLPVVVMNCTNARVSPREPRFHHLFGLPADLRIVLYHGGLSPGRGIEQLLGAMPDVPGAALVLMGYGPLERRLPGLIAASSASDRVFVAPPVPPDLLIEWVAAADVAAMPIQDTTLNHRLTTPNKMFEAMAAGVPIVASDLPGMAAIIDGLHCGLTCDATSSAAIARAIARILSEPGTAERMRDAGLAAARGQYSWSAQALKLTLEYGRLTGRPW